MPTAPFLSCAETLRKPRCVCLLRKGRQIMEELKLTKHALDGATAPRSPDHRGRSELTLSSHGGVAIGGSLMVAGALVIDTS